MPLYEYQCNACGRFEIIHKFSDAPLTSCPQCGNDVQKLPSAPAIQFKGTGWYITDYARKSGGDGSAKGESKTESKGESKGESKSESPAKDAGTSGSSTSTSKDTPAPSK